MSWIRLPVDKPVTTIMIFVGISLMGFISWTRLPQELFPSLAYPQISIITKYEGAGPEEAEKLISKIVEETIGTVKHIRRVSSISKEGTSLVICEFAWGTDMNFASLEVREKIDLVKERLPRDSREPIVMKYNPFQMEAMVISASYNRDESDPWKLVELRQQCKKNLKDELERIDGVAKVEIRGGEQKEIIVEVDKGRILANEFSLLDVIKTLRETNITYPAGVIKEELYEYPVKTVGEFQTVPEISEILLNKPETQQDRATRRMSARRYRDEMRDQEKGRPNIVYLRDIAEVHESIKDSTGHSRYNGKNNISLSIYPQSGSNLVKISKAVHKRLVELRPKFAKDVELRVIYDQSDFIKSSLNNIYSNAVQGGVLSFVVLFVFLKNIFASAIIMFAIPLSVLPTLALMYFSGISINTMSLGGLALGVGMVVDNSNVVLEAIFTHALKSPGKPKKEVIVDATREIVSSVIGSTLTTISIFLPFIFVTGVAGQLFKELALTISFSMIASVLVALLLVPRLALHLDFERFDPEKKSFRILDAFPGILTRFLAISRRKTLWFIFWYAAVGLVLFMLIPKEFMPKMDERRFVLNITLPPQTTLKVTDELVKRAEQYLSQVPEVKDLVVNVGSSGDELEGAVETLGSHQARLIVRLKRRGRHTDKIVSHMSREVKGWRVKDLETEFVTQQGLFGSQIGSSSGLLVEVKGKHLEALKQRTDEIVKQLAELPEIYGVKVNPSNLVPELRLEIMRDRASLFGLNVQDISATILAAIKGYVATKFKEKEDEYDIRVRLRPQDRAELGQVGELTVYSPFGKTIQLRQISELKYVQSMPEIRRIEGQRTYLILANVRGGFSKVVRKINGIADALRKPGEDIQVDVTGEMLALRESFSSAVFAIALGIVIIYMILASQFESLLQPLIMMIAVPLGLIGGVYSLFITFNSINSVSLQGMVMLIGISVNNGIILVDYINSTRLRRPDKDLRQLVVECTFGRLRAILMTTLTTILGLIPIALGLGEGAEATAPMAITIMGGLTFSLMLTLFFVPMAYLAVIAFTTRRTVPEIAEAPPAGSPEAGGT